MNSFFLPDLNVWFAATHQRHGHHHTAYVWFSETSADRVCFCRTTQLGLLRLLTNEVVMMEEVLNQRQAWRAYHRWRNQEAVDYLPEPSSPEFEQLFEKLSLSHRPSTKLWADAYLAALARFTGCTLVTFDKALSKLAAPRSRLLLPV